MPNLNDQHFYHFKQYTVCDQNPFEKSVTEALATDTISDQRQGSWNFWSHLGQPNAGEFTVHNGICWEFIDFSSDPSSSGLMEYGVTSPPGSLTPTGTTCAGCVGQIPASVNYHAFRGCFDPGQNVRHVIDGDVDSALTTASNNAVYVGLGSPTTIGTVTSLNLQCWEYMGEYPIGDPALDYGEWYFYSNTTPWDAVPAVYGACEPCQTANASTVFHKWRKCTNSTVLNIVAPSMPDDSPSSIAFYQSVGSPDVGDVINMDPTGTPGDMCYTYMGESSTAEPGTAVVSINALYSTFSNTLPNPCADCLNPPILGCTDPAATNYDPNATQNDGSCTFDYGCTDPLATNYSATATYDDGSCEYCVYGCTDPLASNYNSLATCDDGSCIITSGGSGGCDITLTTEVCQPDGTASVDIDLSLGQGLTNLTTTIDGAPYGTSTGCATPPSTIPVTGLTEGQIINVTGECSYAKEDYNFDAGGNRPEWANLTCGEELSTTTTFSADTTVYVWYDTSSWGGEAVISAYNAVLDWLDDQALNNGWTGNVYHILAQNERFVNWAEYPMTGNLNLTGGNDLTSCSTSSSSSFGVSSNFAVAAGWITHNNIPNWYHAVNIQLNGSGSVTVNKDAAGNAIATTTYTKAQIDAAMCMNNTGYIGPSTFAGEGNNGLAALPPQMPAGGNFLNVIFLDESTDYNTGSANNTQYGNPSGSGGYTTSSTTNQSTGIAFQAELQVKPNYILDYDSYVTAWKAWDAGAGSGRTFLYPTYPQAAGTPNKQHYGMPQLAGGMILSGNKTPSKDGHWNDGTANTEYPVLAGASFGKLTFFEDGTQGQRHNVFWDKANATHPDFGYGGLDNYGWGTNVNMDPSGFTAQTFETDLTSFLSSGPPIVTNTTTCTDQQCIFIQAVDENGAPIMGYPIKLNGVSIGTTNAAGIASHILTGPGPAVVNDCYTFTAVGSCFQSLITIVISQAQYTTTLNCILGCTDPLSWNYNPLAGIDDGSCMYPMEEDPRDSMSRCELLKIDTECNFATDVYNLYKNKRYGLDPGCLYNMDGRASKKYSSDWVDRLLPDYGAETFTKTKHTNGATPKPDWVDATNCGVTKRACDGSECIVVVVENKNGDRIPDYEIVLDGLYAGKTDSLGILRLNIPNAAEDTEHKINLCHCFTTTGNCDSQKIEITVDGLSCDDCGNIKMF